MILVVYNSKEDISTTIRVNIDKENVEYIDELIYILDQNNLLDLNINFAQVTSDTDACKNMTDVCYNKKDFSNIMLQLQNQLFHYKDSLKYETPFPKAKFNYCYADHINSFVIDPEGYMYKCWNEIGDVLKQ